MTPAEILLLVPLLLAATLTATRRSVTGRHRRPR